LKRGLRYHGRWIFTKNAKNLFFLAVQIEKTEINILQKEWGKGLFDFLSSSKKTIFEYY